MKAFHFSLEKVLDHRVALEQEAKRNYAEKQKAVIQKEQLLTEMINEKNTLMDVNEMTLGRMQVQHRYLNALEMTIHAAYQQVRQLTQEVEIALLEVVQAQQERKVVEKLKEKKLEEYNYELLQEEQKQLDEMGSRKLAIN
jgi:flagellar FliJ protein